MKITRLWIEEFRNLKHFLIEFNNDKPNISELLNTTVIIGRNGSGKSNLLEAIVFIFRNLHMGIKPKFSYRINYTRNYHGKEYEICIEANALHKDRHRAYDFIINGQKITYKEFYKNGHVEKKFLPKNIFAYYSGKNHRLESCFNSHEAHYKKNILLGRATPLRPLVYVKDIYSQFILLSYFGLKNKEGKDFLKDYLGIEGIDSILFKIKIPDSYDERDNTIETFYGLPIEIANYIESIYKYSLSPIYVQESKCLYLFIKNEVTWNRLVYNEFGDYRSVFKRLEAIYLFDCIESIEIIVKTSKGIDVNFNEFSEGEQQLLVVFGILKLFEDKESLFLLDEPDTHLNPKWKLEYLKLLEEVVGKDISSQIIISTHDPIMIGGLVKEQVRMITKNENSGHIIAQQPETDPRGMGFAGLLTSELYGFRSSLDLYTLSLLDEKREIVVKKGMSKDERARLTELNDKLKDLDFANFRDDTHKLFIYAYQEISRREILNKPILTGEEIIKRKKLAKIVLDIVNNVKENNI
ncbi:AAA family ATPase [Bacillus cereus]|uniref:AAA family ATPase n=1 Tax=Bacillus cereus TaxID=1396 RepID=UPI000BF376B9|nr:AAA family ATPase [Bacillus cereus]PFD04461.1 hypothetical protein CN295_30730 [Bacillus cereus]